jgi:hypothetical protein
MPAVGVVIAVGLVGLLAGVVRLRRLTRRMQEEQPEWSAEWRRANRSRKRRISKAIRRGEPLYDPDDAELLVGLGRRAELAERVSARRWWRWHVPVTVVAVGLAVATGRLAVAAAAMLALGSGLLLNGVVLPRARARRRRAVRAAEQLHGIDRS